jgi:hypothetical protein
MPVCLGEPFVGTLYLSFVQVSTESPQKRQGFAVSGKNLPLTAVPDAAPRRLLSPKINNTNGLTFIFKILYFGMAFAILGQSRDEE